MAAMDSKPCITRERGRWYARWRESGRFVHASTLRMLVAFLKKEGRTR